MDEEKELLLDDASQQSDHIKTYRWSHRITRHPIFSVYLVVFHIILCISVFINLAAPKNFPQSIFPELRTLRHSIQVKHATNHTEYSNYSGPPNEANAAAWAHLLQPLYFNASEQEVRDGGASPNTSVRVKEGGYIGALGVYHEIHCLNKLRFFLYTRNLTEAQRDMWEDHLGKRFLLPHLTHSILSDVVRLVEKLVIGLNTYRVTDHCLEVLRISVMCIADTSLYTFSWPQDPNARFLDAHSRSPRKCADWEQLERYSWGRKIGLAPTLIKDVEEGNRTIG